MTSSEIRERFLSYFEKNGHRRVASSPVIPWGDPTLMFTNAGMNQFKDLFLGMEKRDYIRATTCQKCIRAGGKHNDLDEVGRTTRHGTFLEMLGNFSFGDYFKRDAIKFAWGFMVGEMGLSPDELYPSVYTKDDEAFAIWRDEIGVQESHILRFGNIEEGDEENFWSMGPTGPCGPCSEIYIDRGKAYGPDDPYESLANNYPRFLELWNLVFMQFNRKENGTLEPLPKPSIDTGLGLERMAMIKQGKDNIFETDILGSLVRHLEQITGKKYSADEKGMPFRVAADHVRTLTFAIADGALPSNEGRGYVLRRVLRRASRYLRELGIHTPTVYLLVEDLVRLMGDAYPEIGERSDYIAMVIKSEEERFLRTLDQGIDLFEKLVKDLESKGSRIIDGEDAFRLYDTYGFPIDLTRIMADEKGLAVDMDGFGKAMEAQRDRAREASSFAAVEDKGAPWNETGSANSKETLFVGYETDSSDARLLRYRIGDNGTIDLVFDKTPFYAMSGGQLADTGIVKSRDGSVELAVKDVRENKTSGRIHICEPLNGAFTPEKLSDAVLIVDSAKRRAAERNHTATHLLQAGLQKVLGGHIRQSGSFVDSERLRFDFNHFSGVKQEELELIEEFVNSAILANHKVDITLKSLDEARADGAMSLFEEKYGDTVRVVTVDDVSKELCGGTHVKRSGDIGSFRIVSESSVAAGIRRIEGVTGLNAWAMSRSERELLHSVSMSLNVPQDGIVERIDNLGKKIRDLEKEIKRLRTGSASGGDYKTADVDGIKVVFGRVEAANAEDLKSMADGIKNKISSGAVIIGTEIEGKVSIVAAVTDDIIAKRALKAGDIVKKIAEIVGGSGGGKPHMAMAGGKDTSKLDGALESAPGIVEALIK